MTKSKILAFNWKTNPSTFSEALGLFKSYKQPFENLNNWQKIVFPPFVYLYSILGLTKNDEILASVGSQDISEFDSGAHTSQVSGAMLQSLGCKYTLVGHSETRGELGITSLDTAHKIKSSLKYGLSPVLCVGFDPQSDNQDVDFEELKSQILIALEPNIEKLQDLDEFIIAYEPTFAIGTGKTPTLAQIEEVNDFIQTLISDKFGSKISQKVRILYGGSINESNISEFNNSDKIDGFLIGGASLLPEKVIGMIKQLVG